MTSTRSLKNDTYPIALSDIKPGDIYVAPGVHSYQIIRITDKGVAEVIIRKQRNGPIGKCKLTFMGQYTLFADFVQEEFYGETEDY